MKDDPLWIDVTELLKKGTGGLGEFVTQLLAVPVMARYLDGRLGFRREGLLHFFIPAQVASHPQPFFSLLECGQLDGAKI